MTKVIISATMILINFFGGVSMQCALVDVVNHADSIVVYIDGNEYSFASHDSEFVAVLNTFNNMCEGSHEMPALGVSLHHETLQEMANGVWIEFKFDNCMYYNDMPFESLLINIGDNDGGFNLIRKYNGEYSGRCFYLSLFNNDTSVLKSVLQHL